MSTSSANPDKKISKEELDQRVAILRRFRELLVSQRERFSDYLEVLDQQRDVIENGDEESILAHVELEEKIVADIFAIQKVVDPLEDMYRAAWPEKETEVPKLKAALEELKNEAIERAKQNREMLSKKMEELRNEIKSLRNNPFLKRKSAFQDSGSAALIDLQG